MNREAGQSQLILVVEDNSANQMLAEAVLLGYGYRVHLAASAEDALASIGLERPDLILMDIQLPGQDGLSLTRQLKADPAQASIPVVAVTAHAMPNDRQLSLDAGCVDHITKPFSGAGFGDRIGGLLRASQE